MNVDPDNGTLASPSAARRRKTSTRRSSACSSCPPSSRAELAAAAALVLDEFQEIIDIDPHLPKLLRAIFQAQPEVAHVYLAPGATCWSGSSTTRTSPSGAARNPMELSRIPAEQFFAAFIVDRYARHPAPSSPRRSTRCCA